MESTLIILEGTNRGSLVLSELSKLPFSFVVILLLRIVSSLPRSVSLLLVADFLVGRIYAPSEEIGH